jgi:polyhydroxyalkanoate synthesis regulator phasin
MKNNPWTGSPLNYNDLMKQNPWDKSDIGFGEMIQRIRANSPRFSPLDMSGLGLLSSRIAEANRLANDPLSSAGAQKALEAINQGAARRAAFERGAAIGRGAATGGNAFSGSLAQTAGDIASRQNDAVTAMTGELAKELMQQYRAEGMNLSQAYAAATNDLNRIQTERGKARADWESQMASLMQQGDIARKKGFSDWMLQLASLMQQGDLAHKKGFSDWALQLASLMRQGDAERYRAMMDQARIAEEARQFNVLHPNDRHIDWMKYFDSLFYR